MWASKILPLSSSMAGFWACSTDTGNNNSVITQRASRHTSSLRLSPAAIVLESQVPEPHVLETHVVQRRYQFTGSGGSVPQYRGSILNCSLSMNIMAQRLQGAAVV